LAIGGLVVCGQSPMQGTGAAPLCGEAPAGLGDCPRAHDPAAKKINAKAKT